MKLKLRQIILIIAIVVLCFSIYPGSVTVAQESEVYLGGVPLGIGLAENGLIVTGICDVITNDGAVSPCENKGISVGDVIIEVNGESIFSVQDFAEKVQKSIGNVTLTLSRGENNFKVVLTPATDCLSGLKRLGVTVRKGINGIGTLTFASPENNRFGALGHGIIDADTGKLFISNSGTIYKGNIVGYSRAENNKAGELHGKFSDRLSKLGEITICNNFGIYGTYNSNLVTGLAKIPLGNKDNIRTGKAYIYTTIEGDTPKRYAIEIVKTSAQNKPQEKSMLIKIIDETLLAQTGGILQGMSGSPIVQNGKLIGAVTHVLINDSTLGYGLYIDWMLK